MNAFLKYLVGYWYLLPVLVGIVYSPAHTAFHLTVVPIVIGFHALWFQLNALKRSVGLTVQSLGIILFYIALGWKTGGAVPIFDPAVGASAHLYINPLVHTLMLTAVVVSAALTMVSYVQALAIWIQYGTLDMSKLDDLVTYGKDIVHAKASERALQVANVVHVLVTGVIGAMFVTTVGVGVLVATGGEFSLFMSGYLPPYGIELVFSPWRVFLVVVLTFVSFVITAASRASVNRESGEYPWVFHPLVSSALYGLCVIVLSRDVFTVYVYYELISIIAYGLLSIGRPGAIVAALKYLYLGTVAAGTGYLYGIAYLYGSTTGGLHMSEIGTYLQSSEPTFATALGLGLIVGGTGLKAALFLFQWWLPPAYARASSTASAFVASTMTKVSAYVMACILYTVFGRDYVMSVGVPQTITLFGACAVVFGSWCAYREDDAKRVFAQSSVAHLGLIFIGIGLGTQWGLSAAMLHIAAHAVMKAGLFLVMSVVFYRMGSTRIEKLAGFAKIDRWTWRGFVAIVGSMIGFVPSIGLFTKLAMLDAVFKSDYPLSIRIPVSLAIAAGTGLSLMYFARLKRAMYFQEPADGYDTSRRTPWLTLAVLVLAALTVVGLFIGLWAFHWVLLPAFDFLP